MIGDFPLQFVYNIRYLRLQCGMSEETLAGLVGVTTQQIYFMEHPEKEDVELNLSIYVHYRLCQVFGFREDDMMYRNLEQEGFVFPKQESIRPPIEFI